jgi:hypothetical protein
MRNRASCGTEALPWGYEAHRRDYCYAPVASHLDYYQ